VGVNGRDNAVRSEERTRLRPDDSAAGAAVGGGSAAAKDSWHGLLSDHLFDGRRSPQARVASANRSLADWRRPAWGDHDHITVF
jgi:hypothetical protein